MEKLVSLYEGLDLKNIGKLLPNPNAMMENLDRLMVILVMVGPLVMLGLGLYYFFLSPKEANHYTGYRFAYAMSQIPVWRFSQRVAGIALGGLGLVLTVIMSLISFRFAGMTPPDMVWLAVKCLIWEIVLAIIAILTVNVIIMVCYDFNGNPRRPGSRSKYAKKSGSRPSRKRKPVKKSAEKKAVTEKRVSAEKKKPARRAKYAKRRNVGRR